LRQEFRDIELLDEISRLTYEGKLHPSVTGDRRNTLISSYRQIKGEAYVPATVHHAIRWNHADPYIVDDMESPSWVSSLSKATESIAASTKVEKSRVIEGSTISPLWKPSKRNVSGSAVQVAKAIKKHRNRGQVDDSPSARNGSPIGTRWKENSCAYDVVVMIFYNIWRDDAERWSTVFNALNPQFLGTLAEGFGNCNRGLCDLDSIRDSLRRALSVDAPNSFVWGAFASAHAVVDHILCAQAPILSSSIECLNGCYVLLTQADESTVKTQGT
ncbi:hypothetical protein BD779DRAFT_1447624, partial [Infundibulicybe gibba]